MQKAEGGSAVVRHNDDDEDDDDEDEGNGRFDGYMVIMLQEALAAVVASCWRKLVDEGPLDAYNVMPETVAAVVSAGAANVVGSDSYQEKY
jgi:hypothetical protein